MKKILKKKMSIEDLALSMNKGFKRVENLIEKKIEKLAISTAKGFENMATKEDIKNMATKTDIEELKDKITGVEKRIDDFAETKVSKITFKELDSRVGFIERELEIKSS